MLEVFRNFLKKNKIPFDSNPETAKLAEEKFIGNYIASKTGLKRTQFALIFGAILVLGFNLWDRNIQGHGGNLTPQDEIVVQHTLII